MTSLTVSIDLRVVPAEVKTHLRIAELRGFVEMFFDVVAVERGGGVGAQAREPEERVPAAHAVAEHGALPLHSGSALSAFIATPISSTPRAT